ncbi:hypothetical protein HYFRA_00006531 [Hymenoscyphus fraxineus]|uniref:Uncharacterized protein n=1 Tax=Hymenoscyphus fraxineus TaxID=746836 RepID=A0A9N9KQZ6_9HELO|nr:hypothetical protein HYFRA_00006531 [Hymenoscyphus fraxineus]
MPPKRKSSDFSELPPKKARTSAVQKPELTLGWLSQLTRADLESFSKEELVGYVLEIQAKESAVKAAAAQEDKGKLRAQAKKLADLMASGIEKQMKWQPSCKTGGKRWEYSAMVPSEAVFNELFNIKEQTKEWKQKKIPVKDFERITGEISASMRYGYLSLVKENVTLKWDREALSFSVSGYYGL